MIGLALLILSAAVPSGTTAADGLRVVTTTSDLASLAKRIGGEYVEVTALTSPNRDPHYFNARPSMVVRLNRAGLFVRNGLQLEVGWLPELMRQTNNPAVRPGGDAHVDASRRVPRLEVPEGPVDRSQGHVHPEGNPHYTLDPVRARFAAWNITEGLERIDPERRDRYNDRLETFYGTAESLAKDQRARFEDLPATGVIVYHQQWEYLLDRLGLEKIDEIEPQPGVPPSASHVASLIRRYRGGRIGAVLVAPWNDRGVASQIADGLGVPIVEPCPAVGSCEDTEDVLALFRENADRLYGALEPSR